MYKIHAPALGWIRWYGRWFTMQRDVLLPPDAHSELQTIQVIQSSDALALGQPPLTPEQHPDP